MMFWSIMILLAIYSSTLEFGTVSRQPRKEKVLSCAIRYSVNRSLPYAYPICLPVKTNRKIGNGITTVFLMPGEKYSYISSTLVKEIAKLKGDVSSFVPENAAKLIKTKNL